MASMLCNAQDIQQDMAKADQAYRNYDLSRAGKLYNAIAESYPDNAIVKEKLAALYLTPGAMYDKDMALRYMEDAFKTGRMSPAMSTKYASLLQAVGNFEKASQVFSGLNNLSPSKNTLAGSVNKAYYSSISTPSEITVKNLGDINSSTSDFSPTVYKDGIVFVSTRKNRANTGFDGNQVLENYSDLFQATLTNAKLQTFEKPTELLDNKDLKYMQGPVTFSEGYAIMYGTRSIVGGNKNALQSTEDKRTVLLEIFKSTLNSKAGAGWGEAQAVVLNRGEGYQNYSYAHPAFLNGSGTEMIFASNMPGGFGGTDLYYTKLIGAEWSTPVNLGPEINTAGQEMFPFVGKDGTLYFSSNGLPGLGGLDCYKATGEQGRYSGVKNMGAPLNTPFDDFALVLREGNGEGYLTSNRPGGKGDDDIYYWKTNECVAKIKVYAAATGIAIPKATVKVVGAKPNTYTTDDQGILTVNCNQVKNSDVTASAVGFLNKKITIKELTSNKLISIPLDVDYTGKCKFTIIVLDKATKEPIADANVSLRQLSTEEEVTGKSKADGSMKISGVEVNEMYEATANKVNEDGSKYIGNPEQLICTGKETGPVVKYIYLNRAKVGSIFKLDMIYYDLDKWAIKPRAALELDNVVSILKQNPTMEIEMRSHTDCRATKKYNETLSGKRAASSVEYLISRGISSSRLTSKGYGENELKNDCACEGTKKSTCTEDQHQENRRTEFKINKF